MPIRLHTVATEQGMAVIFEERTDELDNFMVIHPGTVRRADPIMYMTNSPADVYDHKRIKTIDGETFSFKKLLRYGVVNFDDVSMLGLTFRPCSNEVMAKVYGTSIRVSDDGTPKKRQTVLSALVAAEESPWKQSKSSYPSAIGLDLFGSGVVSRTYERDGKQETEEDRYDLIVKLPYGKPLFRRPQPAGTPADSSAS